MEDDLTGPVVGVETGNPINDQMLARTKENFRLIMDATIHPIIDQAEKQKADLSARMAVLVISWLSMDETMTREQLASLLALSMFKLAESEREPAEDGKTVRRA